MGSWNYGRVTFRANPMKPTKTYPRTPSQPTHDRRVFVTHNVARLALTLLLAGAVAVPISADEAADAAAKEDQVRRTTAVALNYCRAALHRIRRNPQKHIFYQEQTRILNNLDLNMIEDPEVIALYKSILDEISQVEISERERVVIREQFRRNISRQLGTSFFIIGAQVATGQLGNAIQSGANSWWDYRSNEVQRDANQWKVEKSEFTGLMSRSGRFLDSFWKLSQKNKIPDKWLIRDQDLDRLARILQERDPAQRLRMLKRMERFMECYPPFWYYTARTQQQMGLTNEAIKTYQRLTDVGSGHFRQDDMLASCLANMALLQEMQGHPDASRTAMRVMDHSLRNWEANLVCAWILGRHQQFDDAEEMILCNLDENQEAGQSRVALASLYYHSGNKTKLAQLMQDQQVLRDVPVPGLLLSARLLGTEGVPNSLRTYLASTLRARVHRTSRGPSVVLAAAPAWKLRDARPELTDGQNQYRATGIRQSNGTDQLEFQTMASSPAGNVRLTLTYPGTPPIRITLQQSAAEQRNPGGIRIPGIGSPTIAGPEVRYEMGSIELDGVRLSFDEPDTATSEEREVSSETGRIRS